MQPHAHHLAREVKSFATLPDGTRKWLIYIRQWDFEWQGVFRYARPAVPAGGDDHHDGVHLRQLRGEPAQSAASAAPRDLRPADDRGDGRALAPGRAAPRRRPAAAGARRPREGGARRDRRAREEARDRPGQRRAPRRRGAAARRGRSSRSHRGAFRRNAPAQARIPPPRTTTSATSCSVRGGAPKRSTISGMLSR